MDSLGIFEISWIYLKFQINLMTGFVLTTRLISLRKSHWSDCTNRSNAQPPKPRRRRSSRCLEFCCHLKIILSSSKNNNEQPANRERYYLSTNNLLLYFNVFNPKITLARAREVANCIRGGGPIWEHPTSPPQENLCAVRGVDPPPRKPPFSSKVRPPPSNTAVLLEYKEPVFYFDDLMSGRGSPQLARTFLYF